MGEAQYRPQARAYVHVCTGFMESGSRSVCRDYQGRCGPRSAKVACYSVYTTFFFTGGRDCASLVAVAVEQMKSVWRHRRTVGGASSTPSAILCHPGRVPAPESIHRVRKSLRSENLIILHLNGGRWRGIDQRFLRPFDDDRQTLN